MKPNACLKSAFVAAMLAAGSCLCAQQSGLSSLPARHSPEWLKSGAIYQVFVRSFSPSGDLNGVTARLDDLHTPGVNILWLMPIHPDGQARQDQP